MKHLEKQFSTLSPADHEPHSLQELRKGAFNHFKEIGFPRQSWEVYRFTNTTMVEKNAFRLSTEADLPERGDEGKDSLSLPTLLFVNGHYQPDLSTIPPGLTLNTLLDSYNKDAKLVTNGYDAGANPFAILNTAMMNSGLHIHFSEEFDSS